MSNPTYSALQQQSNNLQNQLAQQNAVTQAQLNQPLNISNSTMVSMASMSIMSPMLGTFGKIEEKVEEEVIDKGEALHKWLKNNLTKPK